MARINKIRTLKLFNQMRKTGEEIIKNPDRLRDLLNEAREVMEGKGSGPLAEIVDELKLLWSMLNDYRTGKYRKVPVRTIVSIAGVLLYLVSPIDVIPDFIPVIGMMDDIFIVNFVFQQLRKDLEAYRGWKLEDLRKGQTLASDGDLRDYINVEFEPVGADEPIAPDEAGPGAGRGAK